MSDDPTDQSEPVADGDEGGAPSSDQAALAASGADGTEGSGLDGVAPAQLGATKYVHAAYFVAGTLTAFLSGRVLAGVWNALAAWGPAVRAVPQLLLYGEDERPAFTMVAGAFIGILAVVYFVRSDEVRRWADDVATELSKVVWPTRETVTNGTIVVIVASALAAIYVGLLDQLWAFVTSRVYGGS